MHYLRIAVLAFLTNQAVWAATGNCDGTPESAVMNLPEPLATWGQVVCTPYGHIVAPAEGWVWSNPGAFSPVMIPSQMVRTNPEPVGNSSYFAGLELSELTGDAAEESLAVLEHGFDKSASRQTPLKAVFVSSSGKTLTLNFYRGNSLEDGGWGVWCDKEGVCDSDTRFMILNMNQSPD